MEMTVKNWRSAALWAMLAVAASVLAAAPAAAQKPEPKDTAPVPLAVDEPSAEEQPPRLLNRAEMNREITRHYPRGLRRRRVGGTVVLRFVIRRDGTADPDRIRVESATDAAFVDAAAKVVPRMRFSPATVGGVPVAVWVRVPVTFAMRDRRARPAAESASAMEVKPPPEPARPLPSTR